MARPIKETPILFGEDARRFEERMKQKRHTPKEELEQIKACYELGMKMLERGERTRKEYLEKKRLEEEQPTSALPPTGL